MRHVSSGELVKQIAQVGPRKDMWQHMIGGRSKVDKIREAVIQGGHLECDMWQMR